MAIILIDCYSNQTLGNHEFDNGPDGLTQFLNDLDAQVVCANLDASNEPAIDGLFTKSTVLAVGGEKIGIVGYTISRIRELSTTGEMNIITIAREDDFIVHIKFMPFNF